MGALSDTKREMDKLKSIELAWNHFHYLCSFQSIFNSKTKSKAESSLGQLSWVEREGMASLINADHKFQEPWLFRQRFFSAGVANFTN